MVEIGVGPNKDILKVYKKALCAKATLLYRMFNRDSLFDGASQEVNVDQISFLEYRLLSSTLSSGGPTRNVSFAEISSRSWKITNLAKDNSFLLNDVFARVSRLC
jgi:hypothetical protein